MIQKPMDILEQFPVRKTKVQKEAFLAAVQSYGEALGYPVALEKGSFGSQNVIIGNPDGASYLVTAHYDTCASIGIPNRIAPCSLLLNLWYMILSLAYLVVPSVLLGVLAGVFVESEKAAAFIGLALYWALLLAMRFGPANKSNANDNTSGVVTLLEIARTMPENHRDKVCYVLFDLEEAGLVGSSSYRKAHKEQTERQIVLNLDSVGDGDHLLLIPTKKLRKDKRKLNPLYTCCGQFGKKHLSIRARGYSSYPSDQNSFPYGVGIAALRKGLFGLHLSRIHTKKDTVLDITNVNILRAALITYLTTTK